MNPKLALDALRFRKKPVVIEAFQMTEARRAKLNSITEPKYELPMPGVCFESTDLCGEATNDYAYTPEQIWQAYQAGREAMREEAASVCLNEAEGYAMSQLIRSIK